jgi:hypothetical protein
MNRFLKGLFWEDGRQYKAKSPVMSAFSHEINFDYSPMGHKTLFNLKLVFSLNAWVDGNQERQEQIKNEVMNNAIKRLHYEMFGETESLLHELMIHIRNEDYESSIKTVELIQQSIKG